MTGNRSRCFLGGLVLILCVPAWGQEPDPLFQSWDRNGDGQLTRDELPEAVRGNFDRVDLDHDGLISLEEHQKFRDRLDAAPAKKGDGADRVPRLSESVKLIRGLDYVGEGNPRQSLDLLLPTGPGEAEKPLPLVVFIHGGAWRGGSKEGGLGRLAPLVETGRYAAASINYRLTGEASWPAQIHDCKAAIRWLRGHAGEYGLDPERIGVIGSSAGGHLVAMLGTSGGVAEIEGKLGSHLEESSAVSCVVDEFGPSELLMMGKFPSTMDHDGPGSPESLLVGGPLQERVEVAKAASPISYVTADDPPFLIIHGSKDMTVPFDQSERLHEALEKAGVSSLFIPVNEGGHGGFRSPELERRTRLFFDRHLRGQENELPTTPVEVGQN